MQQVSNEGRLAGAERAMQLDERVAHGGVRRHRSSTRSARRLIGPGEAASF